MAYLSGEEQIKKIMQITYELYVTCTILFLQNEFNYFTIDPHSFNNNSDLELV